MKLSMHKIIGTSLLGFGLVGCEIYDAAPINQAQVATAAPAPAVKSDTQLNITLRDAKTGGVIEGTVLVLSQSEQVDPQKSQIINQNFASQNGVVTVPINSRSVALQGDALVVSSRITLAVDVQAGGYRRKQTLVDIDRPNMTVNINLVNTNDAEPGGPSGTWFESELLDVDNQRSGRLSVVNERLGPDYLHITTSALKPNTRYTVFLTQSQTAGALPARFLGEFLADEQGEGTFYAKTEIVNAFGSANPGLENDQGVADVVAAGALANGAITFPLNWVRIYEGVGDLSVFGTSENAVGGGISLTSRFALP